MVRSNAAGFNKVVKPLFKCFKNIVHSGNLYTACCFKLFYIVCKTSRKRIQCVVRSERRHNLSSYASDFSGSVFYGFMIFKRINRVVSCADAINVHILKDCLYTEVGACNLFVCVFPDALCRRRSERLCYVEITLKFQMCPVIKRISDKVFDCLCPGAELVIWVSISCYKRFFKTKSAHLPPFVMVALKPKLCKIAKAPVFGNVFRA